MTFILVLGGFLIVKFANKIIGLLFILVGALFSHKEILEYVDVAISAIKNLSKGNDAGQNMDKNINIIKGKAGRDIKIIQSQSSNHKKRYDK